MATSTPLIPTVTQAGLAAVFNTQNTGVDFVISHMSFGTGQYAPTGLETALQHELVRVTIAGGGRVSPTQIQLYAIAKAVAGSPFFAGEIGFWGDNGATLLAVYSRTGTPSLYLSDTIVTSLSYALGLAALPANSINVTIDPSQSAALLLLGDHITDPDAHPLLQTDIQNASFNYAVDTGVANAYAVTLNPVPTALVDGMLVFMRATNANTGPSTLALNGLVPAAISGTSGPLQGAEIVPNGNYVLQYNAALSSFRLLAQSGGRLQVQPALNSGHSVNLSQFLGSLGPSGYQPLPNGLMFQWGSASIAPTGTTVSTITTPFPISFPNACFQAFSNATGTLNSSTGGNPPSVVSNVTKDNLTISIDSLNYAAIDKTVVVRFFAIGN